MLNKTKKLRQNKQSIERGVIMIIIKKANELKIELKLENISTERIKEEIKTPSNNWNEKTLRKIKNQLKKMDETIRQQKTCKAAREFFINNPFWQGLSEKGIGQCSIDNFDPAKVKTSFK